MCGIYAILNKAFNGIQNSDMGLLSQMATLTELRGRHSSGIFGVNSKGERTGIVKTVGPSVNLIFAKGWDKFINAVKGGQAVIGHGRWATVGKVTTANAHPFREGDITMVHNGTLRSGVDMNAAKVDVDSHALTKLIAEKGLKEAIGSIEGAWAVIVQDNRSGLIHILRNSERDLHWFENHNGYYIMSQKTELQCFRDRNNLHGEIKAFKANTLYTFDPKAREMVEGDHVPGKMYALPPTRHLYSVGGAGSCSVTKRYPVNQNVVATTVDDIPRAYEIGGTVVFEVETSLEGAREVVFKAKDQKGNHISFRTSNLEAAKNVKAGDTGIGEVFGIHVDVPARQVTYQIRFREIVWEDDRDDQPAANDNGGAEELVTTYGGETMTSADWELMCATQQCWACQGKLDVHSPEETVVVKGQGVLKPFCKDCVDDYRRERTYDVEPHKSAIVNSLRMMH